MARRMAPSGGMRLLLWRVVGRKQMGKKVCWSVRESNHEVLFFKWHYSSMWHNVWKICEASFVLLELKREAEETELLFRVFTFRNMKRFIAKPQKNSQRWIIVLVCILHLIPYKGQHILCSHLGFMTEQSKLPHLTFTIG